MLAAVGSSEFLVGVWRVGAVNNQEISRDICFDHIAVPTGSVTHHDRSPTHTIALSLFFSAMLVYCVCV